MCVHITNAMCDICTHGTVLILQKMIDCPFLVNGIHYSAVVIHLKGLFPFVRGGKDP